MDPVRFWEITPRLMDVEMRGARLRLERQRELTWWAAMLPHLKEAPSLEEFAGGPRSAQARADRINAAWDRVDRSLRKS